MDCSNNTVLLEEGLYRDDITMVYYEPFGQLLNGSYFSSVNSMYDGVLGGNGFYYVLIYFSILVFVALVTESPAPVAVYSLLGGIMFYNLIPKSMHDLFYTIAVLSVAITLYKLFIHKRGSPI